MARYDVYRAPDGVLLLNCQSDLLDHLNTRFVIPLLLPDPAPIPASRLNPTFQIGDETYAMYTQFAASVPAAELHHHIASLGEQSHRIMGAIDMLLTGI